MYNSLFRYFIDFPRKKAISFIYFFLKTNDFLIIYRLLYFQL